jgi:hypothetical protein
MVRIGGKTFQMNKNGESVEFFLQQLDIEKIKVHFIFFVSYEWAELVRLFHLSMLESKGQTLQLIGPTRIMIWSQVITLFFHNL